jgi:hypothetical protein
MRKLFESVLVFLFMMSASNAQSRPDILIVTQPDPLSCCYELRLENRHTPQSMLDQLTLRIITPGVRFQPGAPGPWPAIESDTEIIFGESGIELPPGEAADGFIICIDLPQGSNGAFKIVWSTSFNNAVKTRDTLSIVCTGKAPAIDSLRVLSITPPDQPDESCAYELTLLNRREPPGPLNGLQLTLLTPGATFVGSPSGPWGGGVVDPTTVEFQSDDIPVIGGGQLGGFRVFIRPPGGKAEGIAMRYTTTLNGGMKSEEIVMFSCTPKVTPRCDSFTVRPGTNCAMTLTVYNTHRPQSNFDAVRITVLTPGASLQMASPTVGWNILSESAGSVTFRKNTGVVAPNDSATGFLLRFNPSASGLVRFSLCSMLQFQTICCDTAQLQCEPPPPSTCDSVFAIRTEGGCVYDFGFVNRHQPASNVNTFRLKLETPGAAVLNATAPDGWRIESQSSTEIAFRDTSGAIAPSGKQSGFRLSLQAGTFGNQILYRWCTSLDGNDECCEFNAVTCEQIQPRCDSLSITPLGEYCSYRFDVANLHVPDSDMDRIRISLRDPATVLLDASAPDGWDIDSITDATVLFRKTVGAVPTGEAAEGFVLSLVPSALSTRIALDWCTLLDDRVLCCDTVSVFCAIQSVAPDRVDVITDTTSPCCFEFMVENRHLPRSPLTSFTAEVLTSGVTLYASTIQSPVAWTHVSNDRKITWRTTSSEILAGQRLQGFFVCYDNDATANADFRVLWNTVSNGLIVSHDTLTVKCDQTLSAELVSAPLPDRIALHQNYPNPFNPSATIRFDLPVAEEVELTLHDAHGRLLMDLGSGMYGAGTWSVRVDASLLPSGTYFYRLRTATAVQTRSMLLLR